LFLSFNVVFTKERRFKMEVKYKFHLQKKAHISGVACFANSANKKVNYAEEVKLTSLLLRQPFVELDTDHIRIRTHPKLVYNLYFPDAEIKIVENPEAENFTVMLKGENEKFLETVYNHFIEKTMPTDTIYTKVEGKLLKIEKDEETEGYVIFETFKTMNDVDFRAYKYLSNREMQEVMRHADLETCEEYILMRFVHQSSASSLLL
jgi:hypothetical protein